MVLSLLSLRPHFSRAAVALLVCAGALLGSSEAGARADTVLRVPVSTVRSGSGALYVGVYSRDNWLKPGKFTTFQKVTARRGTVHVTFSGVNPGRYGVAVFHDENGNGKVDFTTFGLPAEGYGFSKTTPFGKPSFDDAAFELKDRTVQPVRLKY